MKNHLTRTLFLLLGLLVLVACSGNGDSNGNGNDGGGDSRGQTLDYTSTTQNFIDALFSGELGDAKGLTAVEYTDLVNERVDLFAQLIEKYEFQEVKINTVRGWGRGSETEESDKRMEITFQFRDKAPEARWQIGSVIVRTLVTEGGSWGIANLQLVRPTD